MSEEESFVSLDSIQRLGKHVVIVSGKESLEELAQKTGGNSLRNLKGIKIVTEDGKHLGELLDVNVFSKSGVISEILLYGPRKLKIDVKRDGLSIGPDAIIVPAEYQKRIINIDTTAETGFVIHRGKASLTVTESIKNALWGMAAKIQVPEDLETSDQPTSTEAKEETSNQEANGRKLVSSK